MRNWISADVCNNSGITNLVDEHGNLVLTEIMDGHHIMFQ
jgi:hypothetical protein